MNVIAFPVRRRASLIEQLAHTLGMIIVFGICFGWLFWLL